MSNPNTDLDLDQALGITPTQDPISSTDRIRAKQDRLAALRERVELRKQQRQGGETKQSASAGVTPKSESAYATYARPSQQPPKLSNAMTETSKPSSTAASAESATSTRSGLASSSTTPSLMSSNGSARRSRKSEELREKLRQKEAQLAALRHRTLAARKRPSAELSSSFDDEGISSSTSLQPPGTSAIASTGRSAGASATSMTPTAETSEKSERAQKHEDNIKRLKMMAAKKRENLARYRSRFAATIGPEATATATTTAC